MAFVIEKPTNRAGDWYVIDRGRNVILKSNGGIPYGGGDTFTITVEGHAIDFIGYSRASYVDPEDKTKGNIIKWSVVQSRGRTDDGKKYLKEHKEEVRTLIIEAMKAFGSSYNGDRRPYVEVGFNTFDNI